MVTVFSAEFGKGTLNPEEIVDGVFTVRFEASEKKYFYPTVFIANKGTLQIDKSEKDFIKQVLKDLGRDVADEKDKQDIKETVLARACGLDCLLERPYEDMVGNSKPYASKEFGRSQDSEDKYVDEAKTWICKAGSKLPPVDGFHTVSITEIHTYFYNNVEQATFTIQDIEDRREWTSRSYNLQKTVATISQENDGFLYNCTRVECIAKIQWKQLPAWTYTKDNGFTLTFFSEQEYNRYIKKIEDEKRRLEKMAMDEDYRDFVF